mgnify:FL=1
MLTAVMFLTRIPVPADIDHSADRLARSTRWFPLVGLAVAAVGAVAGGLGAALWHPAIGAVLAVLATVRVTGAFHEDALADACDGFGGGWTAERVLEIMRDSRVGAFGVVGLGLVTLLRIGALALVATQGVAALAVALAVAHVTARWSSLPLIRFLPYARPDGGTGKPFAAGLSAPGFAIGSATWLGVLALALGDVRTAAIVGAATCLVTWRAGRYFVRRIGGITGDCLGATNQVVETITYLVLALPAFAPVAAPWWASLGRTLADAVAHRGW